MLRTIAWGVSVIWPLFTAVLSIGGELSKFPEVLVENIPKEPIIGPIDDIRKEISVYDWQEMEILIPNYQKYEEQPDNNTSRFNVFVYSAYYDWRIGMIRINSLIPLSFDERIKMECGIYVDNIIYKGVIHTVIHKEHHNKKYASSTLLCRIDGNKINFEDIQKVSFEMFELENRNNKSEMWIALKKIPRGNYNIHELSICVRPWWGETTSNGRMGNKQAFNNAALMLEFINSYLYLGVEKFYLYQNYLELDENVKMVINYYLEVKKVLEIVPYTIPVIPFKQVWDFAQTTMIQDCLLRSTGRTRYLLFVDTDEFVFPSLKDYSLVDYLSIVSSTPYYSNKVGAMWIPMYFHFLEWESDTINVERYSSIDKEIKKEMDDLDFILYRKTCRMLSSGTKKSDKTRRKVIVRPERILYMGIHEPETMLNATFHFIKIPIVNITGKGELGLNLHHYRKANGIVNNDPKKRELVDMYLENTCSNGLSNARDNKSIGGVVRDDIVWITFGTNLYQNILQDIKEMKLISAKKEKK
ncbi:conserve protein having a signal peptide [Cryptosporidium canis]|uniref:Conserve protein having a signal peptide n=1 Tax=Cryptosporidium canis TaxID=195482 RepID=A0A9D5DM96_9CRYT|nr:conserve protein having a signal peptide [Cryptosporidium canis]